MAVIIIVMYLIEVSQFPTHEIVFGTNYNGDSALKETHKRVLEGYIANDEHIYTRGIRTEIGRRRLLKACTR